MIEYLVDTNIWSKILKGDDDLRRFIESLDYAIDTTIYVELIQGSKNKGEIARIEKVIREIPLIQINKKVSEKTIDLIRRFSNSHGLILPDALIAATCLVNELKLITFNVKDFRFIKGLEIHVPQL